MNGLQVRELVVIRINADAEEKSSVTTINYFIVPELNIQWVLVNDPPMQNSLRQSWTDISDREEPLVCGLPPAVWPDFVNTSANEVETKLTLSPFRRRHTEHTISTT